MNKVNDEIIRVQVCITNGELEVLEEWIPLSDAMYGDALINGIINQIVNKENK